MNRKEISIRAGRVDLVSRMSVLQPGWDEFPEKIIPPSAAENGIESPLDPIAEQWISRTMIPYQQTLTAWIPA